MNARLTEILQQVAESQISAEDAAAEIESHVEKDLGFARLDTDRVRRKGMPETVYCPGKTTGQIIEIIAALLEQGQDVLATRATERQYEVIGQSIPEAIYDATARIITVNVGGRPAPTGLIAVVSAGTSDVPVAEEAALTAEFMGATVERVYDVGVAGLHRIMKHLKLLRSARAVIVVAGMEGALPSVVAGLVDRPVIGVPTSIGYGTNFKGLSALLSMLNSCAPGLTVVNIDNGYGAGVAAATINRIADKTAVQPTQDGEQVVDKSSTQKIMD